MRVLGVGHHADLGDLYLRLLARGHEVRFWGDDPASLDVMEGLVERAISLGEGLRWARADEDALVIFETVGWGELQDRLRREGVRVVGGGALGDRLEIDRAYAQDVLRDAGLATAPTIELEGFEPAILHLERFPGRYVLKFSGADFASTRSYVGALETGEDLLAVLRLQRAKWSLEETPRVVLMKHLEGVEVGVGAFFDGQRFLHPANLDWEHKRFFPGNLGELTGEMGTVVSYRGAERLFDATLARLGPVLRAGGYVGYINLNTIVNEAGPWPLELTCRFGYPGFAILGALHCESWDVLLRRVCAGRGGSFETTDAIAVGVVLTVPPFPYPDGYDRLSRGMPVCFRPDLDEADRRSLHYGELRLQDGQLVTAGQVGYAMVVTGCGATIEEARRTTYGRAEKVVIPNMRYRNDIGASHAHDCALLRRWGWLA